MNVVCLILVLALFILPLVFHLTKQIFAHRNFNAALGASLISAIIFSTLNIVFKLLGVVDYSITNTLGIIFKEIPVEQYLLNFSFSFASVSVYLYLNKVLPNNSLQKYSLAVSNLILGLCIAFLFFGYPKWYTLLTFATLLVILFLIEYVGKLRFMFRAYRTFAVMLIPFYLVYGIIFSSSTFSVLPAQVSGMYVLYVPVENHFIALSAMLVSLYMFEFFKSKKTV